MLYHTLSNYKMIRGRIEIHWATTGVDLGGSSKYSPLTEGLIPKPAMLKQWQIMEENSKTCASVENT